MAADDSSIRPFRAHVPNAALVDLRHRVAATRWPDKETVADRSQGAPLEKLQALVEYWGKDYDWRKAEARFNAIPQFVTRIDGVDIQYAHIKSKEPHAMPLIMTHGWPGSFLEFTTVIEPLTNPTAHGGRVEDAFDVVLPTIPGYGFSGKPSGTGWDPDHVARAWAELMRRLGYTHYVAQGGDWGAPISTAMARQAPPWIARHSRQPAGDDTARSGCGARRRDAPAGIPVREGARGVRGAPNLQQARELGLLRDDDGAAADRRVWRDGLAGWYGGLDSRASGFLAVTYGDDPRQRPTRDEVLDDITLYWLTNSSSLARLYWENMGRNVVAAPAQKTSEISLPVAITVFPEDVYRPPETWAKRAFRNLIYFHEVDKGGHFAAWEQPELFTSEFRAAFRSLRSAA